jgi:glycosyltransferase involved in cell wall biosynthesis
MGATVTVVAFQLYNWSDENEKKLNSELAAVDFHYIGSAHKRSAKLLIAAIVEKAARSVTTLFKKNSWWAAMAVSRRNWQLLNWVNKNNVHADILIAHNPAAFYPAWRFAKKHKVPFVLDIEDYHPGETLPENVKQSVQLLMSKLIPQAAYTTYASPLIKEYSEKLLKKNTAASLVVNNYFSQADFIMPPASQKNKLQLVWFSQNIDKGRGLEELLPVFEKFTDSFELTLIGNPKEPFCSENIYGKTGITVLEAMHPSLLTKMLAQFDIGLAIEPGKDLNNTLALSNKILSYFQAGLYILASGTAAQKLFMQQQPGHGICTALDKESLYSVFENLKTNKDAIRQSKTERFTNAVPYNWEHEWNNIAYLMESVVS